VSKNVFSPPPIFCAQCFSSILFYSDNGNCCESQESPGSSTDASYKLRRKLHQNDDSGEVTSSNIGMKKCKPVKSGTESDLTSKDDFWLGDGADSECTIRAIDQLGTTPADFFGVITNPVSSKSAARKRRREARKMAARQQAAQQQAAQQQAAEQQALQIHDQERPSLNDIAIKQNVDKEVSVKKDDKDIGAYCVPIILPDVEDESDSLVVFKKKKANHSYNMRRRCEQRLIQHFNRKINTTDTAKFERSSIAHVITPEELHDLSTKKGLQVLHLSCPTTTEFNNIETINWTIDSASYKKLSTLDFSSSNVAIVTTYEHVKEEKKWLLLVLFLVPSQEITTIFYSVSFW